MKLVEQKGGDPLVIVYFPMIDVIVTTDIKASQNLKRSKWPGGAQRRQAWSQAPGPGAVGSLRCPAWMKTDMSTAQMADAMTGVRGREIVSAWGILEGFLEAIPFELSFKDGWMSVTTQ